MSARARRMTLVEVVVSTAILGVLMLAAFTLLINTQRATTDTATILDLDEESRKAINELRRELRQSGWELSLYDPSDLWAGNQVTDPKPSDATATTPGTPNLSVATDTAVPGKSDRIRFRMRVAFSDPPDEDADWTNDGAATPAKTYVVWTRVNDGAFRNVPGGPIPRYRLVRSQGPYLGELPSPGIAINNLEEALFYRMGWDEVLIDLRFLFPSAEGPTEPPIRIKIQERVRFQNGSLNGV